MERATKVDDAKLIMGKNFIGVDELNKISSIIKLKIPNYIPEIQFSIEDLKLKSTDHLLILGVSEMIDGTPINIINLKSHFGCDVSKEPCFYNQDWYLNEKFAKNNLENKWHLIKKTIFDESRQVAPNVLEKNYNFPKAVELTYIFFITWFCSNEILFQNDYVWCEDKDSHGDRIYIGRYFDKSKLTNNGFSIHRHLAIKNNYGSI